MKPEELITPNFRFKEFFSNDVNVFLNKIEPPVKYIDNIILMAKELQLVRNYIGSPIIITSAYRTPTYNNYCGGVKNSYHTKGMAVDIRVNGMQPYDLAVYVAKLTDFKGFGINVKKNFVHCDMRSRLMVFKY